jgi:hypothetical protein
MGNRGREFPEAASAKKQKTHFRAEVGRGDGYSLSDQVTNVHGRAKRFRAGAVEFGRGRDHHGSGNKLRYGPTRLEIKTPVENNLAGLFTGGNGGETISLFRFLRYLL